MTEQRACKICLRFWEWLRVCNNSRGCAFLLLNGISQQEIRFEREKKKQNAETKNSHPDVIPVHIDFA